MAELAMLADRSRTA